MDKQQNPTNHIYLLRIWREDNNSPWRAIVQNVKEQSMIGFQNLDDLEVHIDELLSTLNEKSSHRRPLLPKEDTKPAPVLQQSTIQHSLDE